MVRGDTCIQELAASTVQCTYGPTGEGEGRGTVLVFIYRSVMASRGSGALGRWSRRVRGIEYAIQLKQVPYSIIVGCACVCAHQLPGDIINSSSSRRRGATSCLRVSPSSAHSSRTHPHPLYSLLSHSQLCL